MVLGRTSWKALIRNEKDHNMRLIRYQDFIYNRFHTMSVKRFMVHRNQLHSKLSCMYASQTNLTKHRVNINFEITKSFNILSADKYFYREGYERIIKDRTKAVGD